MTLLRSVNRLGLKAMHCLEPEAAHNLTIKMLATGVGLWPKPVQDPRLSYQLADLTFKSPLGMAAGFDKNGEVPIPLMKMGFGHVEVGTVTPLPQPGNPRPRNFRLTADKAVINRYGFNNEGHGALKARLAKLPRQRPGILGVNIGANKTSEDRAADYVQGIEAFASAADYFTANISSPNTPGLRDLQAKDALTDLLSRTMAARDAQTAKVGRQVPVLLKIAPDADEALLADIAEVALAQKVDGLIISNTTISRPPLKDSAQASEAGGLSGAPLFRLSTIALAKMRRLVGPDLPIVGVGGIHSGETAWAKICAGANLLQLYSAMVYEGPDLVADINAYLLQKVQEEGLSSLQQAVGSNAEAWASEPLS
ncbi:quinone-dependent dihydroorotate dehydrogenase [Polycladidibacter hongkongensis]|uniref:quinone-dependent dihydroorotate dehydrogenase n=1 Tax=Polycladidibacter hongkongensis TaxID=1647556 RepID=UPI0008346963|nr:quinone-dependent dihydroorotate dehydrogenase [Pseudovibrio hongkongensis]